MHDKETSDDDRPTEADRAASPSRIVLVRHGSTEWSRSGRHTGRTDLALDPGGEQQARNLAPWLRGEKPFVVRTSPLRRARSTCELAGLGEQAVVDEDLAEWNYGVYEGMTTPEIRKDRPGWDLFFDGCPDGEDASAVGARVDRVLARLGALAAGETAMLFAHGHLLRVLTARFLRLSPADGRLFILDAGSVCVLGFDREQRAVKSWNGSTFAQHESADLH